eukprot:TRINITY_DN2552_c0_g1_i1.p1 TRINITY_DN2552_c0_g1~~TRINITY_DN2552_c0_g1_i1.p1  ORF type:complete len:315 (+),score=76.39 TRINITY_DN2552_c0_g1_i1:69-1013(+)
MASKTDALNAAVTAAACAGAVVGAVCVLKVLTGSNSGHSRRHSRRRPRHYQDDDYHHDEHNSSAAAPKRRGGASKTRFDIEEPLAAGWQGFSMVEARELADAVQQRAMLKTPHEVFAELQKGNMRFWNGHAARPEKSAFERRALISKQIPSVAILGCADSRVPVEIVFDAGLGDIHVTRVAGNCLDTASLASLQYAVNHLKVKVLMVMGHEGCGAVKAAGLSSADIAKEPMALSRLLNNLKAGLGCARFDGIEDPRSCDREKVITNVKVQLESLKRDEGIMKKIKEGELLCVGAMYEISSGIVDFFSEISAGNI